MEEMIDYCEQDVVLLQQVYEKIIGVVPLKSHAGVIKGGSKWSCQTAAALTSSATVPMLLLQALRNKKCSVSLAKDATGSLLNSTLSS